MKIGVLGTGDVGRTLAAGFAAKGHTVMIGTRDPYAARITEWLEQEGAGAKVGTFAEAAAFGDVVVLAVGWSVVEDVIALVGSSSFAGRVVIDPTNPLRFEAEGEPPVMAVSGNDSAGERIQRWLPEAKVVKAFNIVGHVHMVDPSFPDGLPDMFICGNEANAKATTAGLIEDLGWPTPVHLGAISATRYLVPVAMVWITYMFRNGFNPNHAFKLLRK